ncbi:glycoside hydrolase family 99-like domain-containing protein [Photobacterium damselae]|uniref:glycoside hydrolase family 99-like domain-containing protein n=1 Tax=Photobacterium damselae TaxID=38293 RepID=UPI001F29A39E|nr:glycoside hydrolase family 99-like domain-containing protein [Photobacterium damselae]
MKIYAIYFPQFYVTDENSKWWGKDFTDWDLVKKAEPLFPNHYQPRDLCWDMLINL